MAYGPLAPCYDGLTQDVDYGAWADFYEAVFRREGFAPKTVLDLACGTGSMTHLLAERGYEMIGVDISPDMLAQAAGKPLARGAVRPLFLCQAAEELDLYGTVDAAVCCLDGLNYVSPDKLGEALRRVHLFLEPGGIFVFDVNSVSKLRGLDGQIFLDENEDSYCVWRAEFDEELQACRYGMDLFARQGRLWRRDFEEHIEYAYGAEQLTNLLEQVGFRDVRLYGGTDLSPADPALPRLFISARKEA